MDGTDCIKQAVLTQRSAYLPSAAPPRPHLTPVALTPIPPLLPHRAAGAADGFRYFWMCDSCPTTVRDIQGKAPFEVLSLAGPIAAALQI